MHRSLWRIDLARVAVERQLRDFHCNFVSFVYRCPSQARKRANTFRSSRFARSIHDAASRKQRTSGRLAREFVVEHELDATSRMAARCQRRES